MEKEEARYEVVIQIRACVTAESEAEASTQVLSRIPNEVLYDNKILQVVKLPF